MKQTTTRSAASVAVFVCAIALAVAASARGPVPPSRATAGSGERVGATAPPGTHLNSFQRDRVGRFLAGNTAGGLDTLRVIVFQVQFQDSLMGGQPGSHRPEVRDSTWFANEMMHLRDYYRGASRDRFALAWDLDGRLYTLPKKMGYYGDDRFEEERVVELVQTVIDSSTDHIDFSAYDHVFVIHAGAGQETDLIGDSRGQIWSSFYDRGDIDAAYPDTTIPGLPTGDSLGGEPFHVDNFSIVPANPSQDFSIIGSLGIWAFQIGNRVGLLPMFDTQPAGVPDSQGLGAFDLMGFGLFNVNGFVPAFPSVFNRLLAGWIDPVALDATVSPRTVTLSDINTGADSDTLCLKIPITENEYYLVVNRVHDANFDSLFTFDDADSNLIPDNTDSLLGAEFDFFLTDLTNPWVRRFLPAYGFDVLLRHTGSGVYIWHVDENVIRETVGLGYLPEDFVDRKGVDLEEADGVQDLDRPGPAGFALGSHWDSFRSGDNNQNAFGTGTSPSSFTNSGVRSGIDIENISGIGPQMTVTLRREIPYTETRRRWAASGWNQPATPVDLDGTGGAEIVVLADTGEVYVFDNGGAEYVDGDADPATIEPWIAVPGELWAGPPAFADLDGGGDVEIVAAARSGNLYAWKSTGVELVDGDNNPATMGVLYAGQPFAAPPMLVDVTGDATPEVVVLERMGDSLRVAFIAADGAVVVPDDPALAALWPASVPGQHAAPPSLAGTPDALHLVIASVDTLSSRAHVTSIPLLPAGGPIAIAPRAWHYGFAAAALSSRISAPATGDANGDGYDEIVISMEDGRLLVFDGEAAQAGNETPREVTLRATGTSAPALGDVDGDGTLEIALWDREYMYLLKSNGSVMADWPRPMIEAPAGDQPPTGIRRGLETPVLGDVDGDGAIEVIFPVDDGTLRAYRGNGTVVPGFPRTGTADPSTPSVAPLSASGVVNLVSAGSVPGLRGVNTVIDTFATSDETALAIQSLEGATSNPQMFWPLYQADLSRQGRVASSNPIRPASGAVAAASFVVYPNPVLHSTVHARVTMNVSATVNVHIYNLEGEEVFSRSYAANSGGTVNTPFDETIDVSSLKSGVYFMRLRVEGPGGSESLVKTFAIRR